jgi:hypothetical protein
MMVFGDFVKLAVCTFQVFVNLGNDFRTALRESRRPIFVKLFEKIIFFASKRLAKTKMGNAAKEYLLILVRKNVPPFISQLLH